MKKTIKLLSMATLMLALGTSSCKKYEEGGNNFRMKKKLIDRNWDLSYVDISSDEIYNKDIALTLKNIYFNDDGTFYVNNENWGEYKINGKITIELSITNQDYINTAYLLYTGDSTNLSGNVFSLGIKELKKDKLGLSLSSVKGTKINLSYE